MYDWWLLYLPAVACSVLAAVEYIVYMFWFYNAQLTRMQAGHEPMLQEPALV